jgi:hypothetical protein
VYMQRAFVLALTLLVAVTTTAAEIHLGVDRSFGDSSSSGAAAAANAHATLVAWTEPRGVFVARLGDPSRRVQLPRWGAENATAFRGAPVLATNGDVFLAVWSESSGRDARYLAIRIASDLTFLDSRPIYLDLAKNQNADTPSAVWNGSEFVAGWTSGFARISAAGAIQEQQTATGARVAVSGERTLIATVVQKGTIWCGFGWCSDAGISFIINGRLLDEHGAAHTLPSIMGEARRREIVAAAGSDSGFLLAGIESQRSSDLGTLTLAATNRDGSSLGREAFLSLTSVRPEVALAANGNGYLMAWTEKGSLFVSQLDAAGRRIGTTVTLATTHDVAGPLALVRVATGRYLLLYPRLGLPSIAARELTVGAPKTRPVRH